MANRLGHVIPGSFNLQAALQIHGGDSMDIDRRGLLKASCLALTGSATHLGTGRVQTPLGVNRLRGGC
jgi:hypothetical protein